MRLQKNRRTAVRDEMRSARDVGQEITDEIIALLEAGGELPWRKPWTGAGGRLPLRHEGTPYRGVNIFMLGLRAMTRGYASPYWMSYRQAEALGGQVRKGERSTPVVFYGVARRAGAGVDAPPDAVSGAAGGETEMAGVRFLKSFAAFNADQISGLPDRYHPARDETPGGAQPVARLAAIMDAMITGLGVEFVSGGDRACYVRDLDRIHMPDIGRFVDAEKYYATGFHELAHSCEHPGRLALDYGIKNFGNEAYARAELMAEGAAAILGATLGFSPDHIEDHAAYVQSWLKALKNDKRCFLKAAADAQRAVDHLLDAARIGGAAALITAPGVEI